MRRGDLLGWVNGTQYFYILVTFLPFSFLPAGLVHHVCNLFTETATLCLDVDNENNNETAAALLCSLLDVLLGMLTYTSGVVRLALQVGASAQVWRSPAPHHAPQSLLANLPLECLCFLEKNVSPVERDYQISHLR